MNGKDVCYWKYRNGKEHSYCGFIIDPDTAKRFTFCPNCGKPIEFLPDDEGGKS